MDYEITLSFYRDCYGVNAPAQADIRSYSNDLGIYQDDVLQLILSEEVSPGCNYWQSACDGGGYPGAELHVYRDSITLPGASDDWIIFYENCCRNSSIVNLVDPTNNGSYIDIFLNNENFPCNNSPVFMDQPNYFLCQDEYFCLNNTAFDPDGDSLVYELVEAMAGIGQPMFYQSGYSAANPISSSSGINFDVMTGNLCITPDAYGVYVINFKVNEHRNGILVGSTTRDIQVAIGGCLSNIMHSVSGVVTDTTGVPVNSGEVELYKYDLNLGAMDLLQSLSIGAGGAFSFSALPYAQYVVRAVPDTITYPNTAATYAASTHYWSYADVQWAHCDSSFVSDIQLVGYGDLLGTGHLSGYLGELGVRSSIGDAFTNVSIHLVDVNTGALTASTRTGPSGHWQLQGVPFGTYKLVVDVPGLSMLEHHYVQVASGAEVHEGLDYLAELIGIGIMPISTEVALQEQGPSLSVYPNPATEVINLDIQSQNELSVQLMDLSGRQLASWTIGPSSAVVQLALPSLNNGSYLVRVDSEEGSSVRKLEVIQ